MVALAARGAKNNDPPITGPYPKSKALKFVPYGLFVYHVDLLSSGDRTLNFGGPTPDARATRSVA